MQEMPDFIGLNAEIWARFIIVLIWLVLFQRAAERVFGKPPEPPSS